MPVTYPVMLSAPKKGRRPHPTGGGRPAPTAAPTAAPSGPMAIPTAPVSPRSGPMGALLRRLPPQVRPLIPIALILAAGYLAFRLGRGRR
jgi:hypothetical protein